MVWCCVVGLPIITSLYRALPAGDRRATSISVGGLQELTKQHRWSQLCQPQSRPEAPAVAGGVEVVMAETSDRGLRAPSAGRPPADHGESSAAGLGQLQTLNFRTRPFRLSLVVGCTSLQFEV